jgi:hypothetical protein
MTAPRVLDHVAIGCASLEQGVAYIRETLGVDVPPGGRHPRMGTHNRLMRVGADVYLELIAIDPDAPAPARPRWFALDEPWQRARITQRPRPIAWVARTSDIAADLSAHPELGRAEGMTRGDLAWRISLRVDGALPHHGLLPVLIEWSDGRSPAARIPDLGIQLMRLRLRSASTSAVIAELERLDARHLVEVTPSDGDELIEVELRSPSGALVTLI